MRRRWARALRRTGLLLAANAALLGLLLALVEGSSSLAIFVHDAAHAPAVAERVHTSHDPELGWVNRPNLSVADMYGPGVGLRTNNLGFRGERDLDPDDSAGRVRLICSGDSFTFGYGVDDDHNWCRLLERMDPALETVNMGLGGYGVDQAYLRYRRDGAAIRHDIHLFAFVTTDFKRMGKASFLGYGKPRLNLADGELVVENVPVPRRPPYAPWLTRNRRLVRGLRVGQLLSRLRGPADEAVAGEAEQAPLERIVARVFEELRRLASSRGVTLALVYLPNRSAPQEDLEFWRGEVGRLARVLDIPLLDLVDAFAEEGPEDELYIAEGALDYLGAAGHYTERGNQIVALKIHEALRSSPELAALAQPRSERGL